MMANIPDYFYDKELCDTIRDIAKNSATTIEDIVKKLATVGINAIYEYYD